METEVVPLVSRSQSRANREILERFVLLVESGQEQEVLAGIEALISEEPDHPVGLYALALIALAHGVPEVALESLIRAHQRDLYEPVYPEVLAVLYIKAGNLAEGMYFGKLSLSLGYSDALIPLLPKQLPIFSLSLEQIVEAPYRRQAQALQKARCLPDAAQFYRRHLAFFPSDHDARRALGMTLLQAGQPSQALACLEELREFGLIQAGDLSVMAQSCLALGETEAAAAYHQQALSADPGNGDLACAQLADLLFYPDATSAQLAEAARAWGASLPDAPALPGPAIKGRRIRIGYLISPFAHPKDVDVIAATIAASDPQQFEIYIYGWLSADEARNAPLRGCYDEWRDVSDLDHATTAATIQGDEIDILVDTGGHGTPLHCLVLAQRAAPRQVSWLGNASGTLGLAAVDVELADGTDAEDCAGSPGGPDGLRVSRRVALPHGLYCYDRPLLPERPPRSAAGQILFGADVSLAQLHPDLLALWAEILAQVPGAKLVLRDHGFSEDGQIDRLVARFQSVGLSERVEINEAPPREFFREVDVALAPLVSAHPHDAVTALCEGTPVVALAGAGRHRRVVASLLRQAGLDRLVAETPEAYVALAQSLATDPQAWAGAVDAILQALRDSPPFDPDNFAAAFDEVMLALAGNEA